MKNVVAMDSSISKIMAALLDTRSGVGLDQNKRVKKIRDLMYLSKENHKP